MATRGVSLQKNRRRINNRENDELSRTRSKIRGLNVNRLWSPQCGMPPRILNFIIFFVAAQRKRVDASLSSRKDVTTLRCCQIYSSKFYFYQESLGHFRLKILQDKDGHKNEFSSDILQKSGILIIHIRKWIETNTDICIHNKIYVRLK